MAAIISFVIAHRSQRMNEKIMHISIPFMVAGAVYSLVPLAVSYSPVLGFMCLTVGVMVG